MLPWMWSSMVWWVLRVLALIMFAIVNDLMFVYNVFIVVVWSLALPAAVYGWLLVHTCYLEFASITRLEDLAHLRVQLAVVWFWCALIPTLMQFRTDGNASIAARVHVALDYRLQTDDTVQHHTVDDARRMIRLVAISYPFFTFRIFSKYTTIYKYTSFIAKR